MAKKILLLITLFLLKFINNARAFNTSMPFFEQEGNNRNGKFLFDALFGLELEEELINNAAQNTLKSCDCGKSACERNENESVRNSLAQLCDSFFFSSSTRSKTSF
jgi:hypothetical protein